MYNKAARRRQHNLKTYPSEVMRMLNLSADFVTASA
jgi:hypothetical protein